MSKKVEFEMHLPESIDNHLKQAAQERGTTVPELMREGLQFVLLEAALAEQGGAIIIEKANGERSKINPSK